MKLREIRDKLLPMEKDANELSVDILFLEDDRVLIDVTWWANDFTGFPSDIDHEQYTLEEFKELLK